MRIFTAVIPARSNLPPDLALLLAPIHAREPSDPALDAGHGEGVVLDEDNRVVAFIVRLSPRLVPSGPRTLMAASAVSIGEDPALHLAWTEAQLLAQPRLDDALHSLDGAAGTVPIEIRSMNEDLAGPSPAQGAATKESLKDGAGGMAVGAAVGAAVGLVASGPIGLSLAAFFALGGGIVGVMAGAMQPTAAEAHAQLVDPRDLEKAEASAAALRRLEEHLQDPSLQTGDLVHLLRFSRVEVVVGSAQERPAKTNWSTPA